MRIISGTYGGRRFETPRNLDARPTTDTAREALFNILQNRIDMDGIAALDLFGGTGAISFELLSRGAASVTCVESGRTQQQFIQAVAQKLDVGPRLQLIRGDVFRYLTTASRRGLAYDLIFADPPYALRQLKDLPDLILGSGLLRPLPAEGTATSIDGQALSVEGLSPAPSGQALPDGEPPRPLFILEHGRDHDFASHPRMVDTRTYGSVHFTLFA